MPQWSKMIRARMIRPMQHHYTVTMADLPLSCPMPDMYLWNSHPRVYLAIEATGWAKCAYCGAEYTLDPRPALAMNSRTSRRLAGDGG